MQSGFLAFRLLVVVTAFGFVGDEIPASEHLERLSPQAKSGSRVYHHEDMANPSRKESENDHADRAAANQRSTQFPTGSATPAPHLGDIVGCFQLEYFVEQRNQ